VDPGEQIAGGASEIGGGCPDQKRAYQNPNFSLGGHQNE